MISNGINYRQRACQELTVNEDNICIHAEKQSYLSHEEPNDKIIVTNTITKSHWSVELTNENQELGVNNNPNKNVPIKSRIKSLKRKIESHHSPVLKKAAKTSIEDDGYISDDISLILKFKYRKLNCFWRCESGILFGGTKALLQLRDEKVIMMQSFLGISCFTDLAYRPKICRIRQCRCREAFGGQDK